MRQGLRAIAVSGLIFESEGSVASDVRRPSVMMR